MRVYLVIIDDTDEAQVALRFASRRAAKVEGIVHLLALVPPQPFNAFGGVQATIEEEARARAETLAAAAAASLHAEGGAMPAIIVRVGEPERVVRQYLTDHPEVSALVLGVAKEGTPGPLVQHFAGSHAGQLSCPLFLIPGSLDKEAIDRVS